MSVTTNDISQLVSKLSDAQMLVLELAAALKECADDLESELNIFRYPAQSLAYPSIRRKYERDMRPVMRAREVLAKAGAK